MRGSRPPGAGRRRPPGGGGESPSAPASLAGCYSAPRRAPLWTCLLLCAALRTLLASPSNEDKLSRQIQLAAAQPSSEQQKLSVSQVQLSPRALILCVGWT
ncbi:hypothetical protein MC885_013635, partial [Smutsia gigantea]